MDEQRWQTKPPRASEDELQILLSAQMRVWYLRGPQGAEKSTTLADGLRGVLLTRRRLLHRAWPEGAEHLQHVKMHFWMSSSLADISSIGQGLRELKSNASRLHAYMLT